MMLRITPLLDRRIAAQIIITPAAKLATGRAAANAAILAKRMSERLTSPPLALALCQVPRGLTRRVGIALAGSSGQGCRG